MRLCDEYCERMGMPALILKHSPRFFLFFEDGNKLFSCKWIHNASSCGHYEFVESSVSKSLSRVRSENVEWDEYEGFLSEWLGSHEGFVFERSRVFDLAWGLFLRRNDAFLSREMNPLDVHSTIDASNNLRFSEALDMVRVISKTNPDVASSWNRSSGEIVSKYAHWLKGFGS